MEELKMNNQRVYQTTYQTPDKKINTGYIINGKTYTNPQGTERVPTGSTVHTGGGDFLLTEAGGVKLPGSVTNDIRRAYDSGYSRLGAGYSAQREAINTATRRNQARIAEQRKDAATQYGNSNRAAYQAYMNASNPYGAAAEQQAKLGLANSGYSESSKLRTANTYQQALSQNALARDAYLRELDNAQREAQYEGDIQLANALAIIGRYGYNMTALRSRPMKQHSWQYYFYVEIDGSTDTESGQTMMKELSRECDHLKVAGTFAPHTAI